MKLTKKRKVSLSSAVLSCQVLFSVTVRHAGMRLRRYSITASVPLATMAARGARKGFPSRLRHLRDKTAASYTFILILAVDHKLFWGQLSTVTREDGYNIPKLGSFPSSCPKCVCFLTHTLSKCRTYFCDAPFLFLRGNKERQERYTRVSISPEAGTQAQLWGDL